MERVESPTVAICNGRRTILLGTYNYMGMTFDPDVVASGHKALDEFGSGTTGSRVLNGTYGGHKAVEQALCDFYAMDHAMVFSTGYQANLGIISTIAGKEDYIVLDIDSTRRSTTAALSVTRRSSPSVTTTSRPWKNA